MTLHNISVYIGGKPLLGYTNFKGSITQEIGKHHFFSIEFSSFLDNSIEGIPFMNHEQYQNQKISIFSTDGALQFVGIILSVQHLKKTDGKDGGMLFRGASPTILLQKTVQCQSFDEATSFRDIMAEVTRGYPANILQTNYGSETSISLGYTVQYNESDWDFITRMSRRYGMFTYYDGEALSIGRNPDKVVQWQGTYGQDIKEFMINDDLEEQLFTLQTHDWTTQQAHTSDASQANSSIPDLVTPSTDRSRQAFTKQGNYYYPHLQDDHSGQQMLDYMIKVQAQSKLSRMVTAIGRTEILGLKPCDHLQVTGHNYSSILSEHSYGSYELTKVIHNFNSKGYYHNEIEGVITGLDHPPYSDIYAIPKIEAMSATVKDNNDTEGLNRLKVQFPWQQKTNTTTGWVRCMNTHAGAAHGSYIVAERGDEVWCSFQGDNPERPLVIGSGFNKTAKSEFYTADNTTKAVKTKSGNTLISNDADGSITAINPSGSKIILQQDGNIRIHAPNTMTLAATDINIIGSNSINIHALPNDQGGDGTMSIYAKRDLGIETADESIGIKANTDITITSTTASANLNAKTDTNIKGETSVNMDGDALTINGGSMIKIESSDTDIL
ncbi:contractile injection system protein, VgrG/Pvc8 family [Aquimarina longa]|uniref:contractile injection system protein, VgrG/Pvc8 family n=1 Tax=Aquimarina longa TaxID=1080221 RepID=UPI000780922F|nr:contractile injection system protein, VgrG/Pvc8 family [Aquimarina longa]